MIVDQYGKPMAKDQRAEVQRLRSIVSRIRARYDSAQTNSQNAMHWANADNLGPNEANSYDVRYKLRSRSRYELIENNSYLKGMVLSRANDMVGSGPRMQITDQRLTTERSDLLERRFNSWAKQIGLREKIWQMEVAKVTDGEAFAIEIQNPRLSGVQLDYKIIEADQCTTWNISEVSSRYNQVDGIRFDDYGNPISYHILNHHPGANYALYQASAPISGRWIRYPFVIHWFRRDRPWQRGVPELTASLPLCALLRRYTLAVVQAAEVAADFAGVLESEGPPNTNIWGSGNIEDDPFDAFPVDKGLFTTLPWGYKLKQLEAEQPTSVYDKFVDALLREIARPLLMPFNLASGFSGGYNFASGTLDRHLYQGSLRHERIHCEEHVLEHMFQAWWFEASRDPDIVGQSAGEIPQHAWRWDWLPDHADPLKSAEALRLNWEYGFVTDDQIQFERFNRDLTEHYVAVQRQREAREQTGLPQPSAMFGEDTSDAESALE